MKQSAKKIVAFFTAFVMLFTCVFTVFPADKAMAGATVDVADGEYYIMNQDGLYVTLGGSVQWGATAKLSRTPQEFTIRHKNGGILFLTGYNASLEVENSSRANGGTIKLWEYLDDYSCKIWTLVDGGNGWLCIRNQNSGLYMDVAGGYTTREGNQVWQYQGNGTKSQHIRLIPTNQTTANAYAQANSASISDGFYKIRNVMGRYVDVKNGETGNEAVLHLWDNANVANQIFYFKKLSNGLYRITPKHSGLPLEVQNSSYNNNGRIQQYQWENGYTTKTWLLVEVTPGYYIIVNGNSGKAMDVQSGRNANGTPITQYQLNWTDSQIFALDYKGSGTEPGNITDKTTLIQNDIYNRAMSTMGDSGEAYQEHCGGSGDWCVYYAVYILDSVLEDYGYSKADRREIIPMDGSTTSMACKFRDKGRHYCYLGWKYADKGRSMTKNATADTYTPKVGDLVMIDNDGDDTPNHTGIIIATDQYGFTTAEGNVSNRVQKVYYGRYGDAWVKRDEKGYWYPYIAVRGICDVDI